MWAKPEEIPHAFSTNSPSNFQDSSNIWMYGTRGAVISVWLTRYLLQRWWVLSNIKHACMQMWEPD